MQVAALAAVVQQAGQEQVGIILAVTPKRGDDIEPVALVCTMHRVEQLHLGGRDPGRQVGPFLSGDTRAHK